MRRNQGELEGPAEHQLGYWFLSADPFLPGYLVYVAAILLPGYGLGEVFGRWREDDGPVSRIGLSLGYGIAFDTLVFALATLGYSLGPVHLAGVGPGLLYFLVAAGVFLLLVAHLKNRSLGTLRKFSAVDVSVVACSGIVALVILLYFQKNPIFPTF